MKKLNRLSLPLEGVEALHETTEECLEEMRMASLRMIVRFLTLPAKESKFVVIEDSHVHNNCTQALNSGLHWGTACFDAYVVF